MADYKPPTEQLPIFDTTVFLSGDQTITQNQADKRYLRYPNAQGTENLQSINVNGTADFNSTVNIDGITTTTNNINMIGPNTTASLTTSALRFNSYFSGGANTSLIATNGTRLYLESYPSTVNTQSEIECIVRNTSNVDIRPLLLTPTINNMTVSLDMTATGASPANSYVKARVFNIKDLDSGTNTSSNIYYQTSSQNLSIDSQGSTLVDTGLYMRIYDTSISTLRVGLAITPNWLKTNIPTLATSDNSNSIPTTAWVNNVLATYAPTYAVKRAWVKKDNISSLVNGYSLNIPDAGTGSTTWTINEMVSFRLTFNQEWSQVSGRNTIFNSSSCILNVYPYRFTAAWLTQNIGSPTLGSLYTRGTISDNTIYATSSTNNYVVNDVTYCPNGRQFFSYDLLNSQSGTTTAKLNISGDPSGLLLGRVTIWVVNPPGYNATATPQNYNLSVELLNPSDLTTGITASGGWDVGF
jgi:hypothetical protein